jgi:hypothetical protein
MPTILEPTSAEVQAAGYLYQRDAAIQGLVVASEAIDRLHDVTQGKSGASADEIAYIINSARETIAEALLLGGYYERDSATGERE